jgi:hypothetical protein
MTDQPPDEERPKLELKPLEIGAGAGAAVITAFASSALGVAGTVGGAAVASVLTTVSTSVLRHSAHRTTLTLRRYRVVPVGAAAGGPANVVAGGAANFAAGGPADFAAGGPADFAAGGPADVVGGSAGQPVYLAGGTGWPDEAGPGEPELAGPSGAAWTEIGPGKRGASPGEPAKRPRWLILTGATVAVFVLAMLGITAVEAAIGRPLSGLFGHGGDGRSSVRQVFGGHSDATPKPKPTGGASTKDSESAGKTVSPTQPPAGDQPPAASDAPPVQTGAAGDTGGDTGGGTGDAGGAGDQGGVAATP